MVGGCAARSEAEVVVAECALKAGDGDEIASDVLYVGDCAWVFDGVGSTHWRGRMVSDIVDVDDASSGAGQNDIGVVKEAFNSEDLYWVVPLCGKWVFTHGLVQVHGAIIRSKNKEGFGSWGSMTSCPYCGWLAQTVFNTERKKRTYIG